ncbi:MAG: SHOCT domain-containing protein [Dehalococcoidia bacterium]
MMWGSPWMWLMPVFMVVFWGLVIWAVVTVVRGFSQPGGLMSGQKDSALEILKRRYARGEIGKEEYEEKRREFA